MATLLIAWPESDRPRVNLGRARTRGMLRQWSTKVADDSDFRARVRVNPACCRAVHQRQHSHAQPSHWTWLDRLTNRNVSSRPPQITRRFRSLGQADKVRPHARKRFGKTRTQYRAARSFLPTRDLNRRVLHRFQLDQRLRTRFTRGFPGSSARWRGPKKWRPESAKWPDPRWPGHLPL